MPERSSLHVKVTTTSVRCQPAALAAGVVVAAIAGRDLSMFSVTDACAVFPARSITVPVTTGPDAHPTLLGVLAATISVLIGSLLVGFAMFHLILKRLDKEIMIAFFVATLGVSFFLENLVAKLADFRVRSVPALFTTHAYVIEGLYITNSVMVSLAAALIITFGLLAFLNYTEPGQLLRAVAENAMLANGVGINTRGMTLLAVLIGSCIAVIGGLLYANTTSTADPFVANTVSLKMFAVAIVAGIGSVGGALVVGLCLGIAESLTLWVGVRGGFDGSQWQNVIGLVLMVVVLMTRPHGLFGKFERIG